MTGNGSDGRFRLCVALAVLTVGFSCATAGTGEEVLLGEEAAASIVVDGEHRLFVDGIHGTISVRGESSTELRFRSVDAQQEEMELPVALWSDETSFRITPTPGTEAVARNLEIGIPAEMYVRIRTTDGTVRIADMDGAVEISGRKVLVVARQLGDGLEIDVEEGRVHVEGIASDVIVRGGLGEADIREVNGLLVGRLRGGTATFGNLNGGADLELQNCTAAVSWVRGEFRLRATGGELEVTGLQYGGRLELSGTPIGVSESAGSVEIESDTLVRFHDNDASVLVTGFGASVRGATNRGSVSVETDGGSVGLEKIDGPISVKGSHLEVQLEDTRDEVVIETTSSSVEISKPAGEVTVENEFGDVTVTESMEKVTVTSKDGDVFLWESGGPVHVEADGPRVEVEWKTIGVDGDSLIQNDGGDVVVRFPPRAGCVIDASSGFGRIESELPGVAVSDDGGRASGMMNRRGRPRVKVRSDGRLRLLIGPSVRERRVEGEGDAAPGLSTGASRDRLPSPRP